MLSIYECVSHCVAMYMSLETSAARNLPVSGFRTVRRIALTRDQPLARLLTHDSINTGRTLAYIYVPSGLQTYDPIVRAVSLIMLFT